MKHIIFKLYLSVLLLILLSSYVVVDVVKANVIDFVHYDATLEPNLNDKSVKGSVKVKLIAKAKNMNEIVFSAKYKSTFNVVSDQ